MVIMEEKPKVRLNKKGRRLEQAAAVTTTFRMEEGIPSDVLLAESLDWAKGIPTTTGQKRVFEELLNHPDTLDEFLDMDAEFNLRMARKDIVNHKQRSRRMKEYISLKGSKALQHKEKGQTVNTAFEHHVRRELKGINMNFLKDLEHLFFSDAHRGIAYRGVNVSMRFLDDAVQDGEESAQAGEEEFQYVRGADAWYLCDFPSYMRRLAHKVCKLYDLEVRRIQANVLQVTKKEMTAKNSVSLAKILSGKKSSKHCGGRAEKTTVSLDIFADPNSKKKMKKSKSQKLREREEKAMRKEEEAARARHVFDKYISALETQRVERLPRSLSESRGRKPALDKKKFRESVRETKKAHQKANEKIRNSVNKSKKYKPTDVYHRKCHFEMVH